MDKHNPSKQQFDKFMLTGYSSGGVGLSVIADVATELGVKFPSQYVEILQKYGSCLIDGIEISGIVTCDNEPPMFQSIINETTMRRKHNSFFAKNPHYIPFSTNGMSKIYFFDTHQSPETIINSYEYGVEKFEFDDIYEFVVNFRRSAYDK